MGLQRIVQKAKLVLKYSLDPNGSTQLTNMANPTICVRLSFVSYIVMMSITRVFTV